MRQRWDRDIIRKQIRKLYNEGKDLSYNAMARKNQALVSAANYHFGAYKRAVMMAGIDYSRFVKKPWWTPAWVVRMIRQAKREGRDLCWKAVGTAKDPLGHAAMAAVKPRLFGSWNKALEAAGLNIERVRRYKKWDAQDVLGELRRRTKASKGVNSGVIQGELPGMYGAAVRHFGSYDEALMAARLDPSNVRQRRQWSRAEVLREAGAFRKRHRKISSEVLRKHDPGLLRAVIRYYRNVPALEAALTKQSRQPKAESRKSGRAGKWSGLRNGHK